MGRSGWPESPAPGIPFQPTRHSGGEEHGDGKAHRRRRLDPTDDWEEQLELLCDWEEQVEYEKIRPLVLYGEPVPVRATTETATSMRTLYLSAGCGLRGARHGESLFGAGPKRRVLPASLRRLSSWTGQGPRPGRAHPALNLNEIARIYHVRTGRKPHLATVRAVLEEEPLPIKAFTGALSPTTRYRKPGSAGGPWSPCITRGGRTRA